MSKSKELIEKMMLEMAYSRDKFVDRTRDFILSGASGEYVKLLIARKLKTDDFWSNEVRLLLKPLESMFDPKKIRTKTKFNRIKAFKEAFNELIFNQKQITDAKNDMVKNYPKHRKKILRMTFDIKEIAIEMLKEFKPELFDKIFKD